jgi:hypothetical protein
MGKCCILSFLITLLLVGCGEVSPMALPTAAWPAEPQANFAFRFAYGSCFTSTLDTFEQTYRTVVGDLEPVTIPVKLTGEQMTAIYQKMMAIGFFSYPAIFRIQYDQEDMVGMVTPASDYRIEVRNGEQQHEVFWRDEITDPTSPEAEHLRELFMMIIEMIKSNPDVQNLPPLDVGCA